MHCFISTQFFSKKFCILAHFHCHFHSYQLSIRCIFWSFFDSFIAYKINFESFFFLIFQHSNEILRLNVLVVVNDNLSSGSLKFVCQCLNWYSVRSITISYAILYGLWLSYYMDHNMTESVPISVGLVKLKWYCLCLNFTFDQFVHQPFWFHHLR